MTDEGQIQNDGDGQGFQRKLSALSTSNAANPADNGARAVARAGRPPALVGVVIPGRDRSIRRMVVQLYWENSHLPSAARGVVAAYCKALRASERVYQRWKRSEFEPGRDADLFFKALAEARHHAGVLGLTPVSMASLGVDLGRMRKLQNNEGGSETDVAELEARLLARLEGHEDDDGD
jgi:hypothetical protein